jgi:N-acetylmuramic acid 6-phosphate etherase
MLNTETPSGRHPDLDLYATTELIRAFTEDQVFAANVVHAAAPQIARAVDAAAPRIAAGGRLIYAGAGTSGRLGLLDSVELWPTFTWPKDRVVALHAGGQITWGSIGHDRGLRFTAVCWVDPHVPSQR